jgi:MFS family permease
MGIVGNKRHDAAFEADLELRNGWLLIAASIMGLAVGQGTVNLFCFGIFLKPVSADLGVARATLSSGLLWASVVTALATPAVGMLVDRFGSRPVMLPGIALFALSVAALSTMQASSLVFVYLLFALTGLFAAVQPRSALHSFANGSTGDEGLHSALPWLESDWGSRSCRR